MPCSSTSQLTNAPTVPLPSTMPTTQAQWSIFLQRLIALLNLTHDAAAKTGVNVVPAAYAVYDGAALPTLAVTGATAALDSSLSLFGNASLQLTATASTVTVAFPTGTIAITPFTRWIASVYVQSNRTTIAGTLAAITASESYPVNIGGTLLPTQWGRLYGDCDLRSDDNSSCTFLLTLTGCNVGDTFNLEAWQFEATGDQTNLPSPFSLSAAPGSLGAIPDDTTYAKLLASHSAGNVAYNFRGVWNGTTKFVIGDEVVYGEAYWLCTQINTNNAPAQTSSYWQAIGTYNDYQGAWSGTTTYQPGNEVTYNGNFWVCVVTNTNSAPTTTNTNWVIAGPATLDNVVDGTSRFAIGQPGIVLTVTNPYFIKGLSGWTQNGAGWTAQTGATGNPYIASYALFSGGPANAQLFNNQGHPCQPGDVFQCSALISGNGGTGTARAGVAFFNSAGANVTVSWDTGAGITGSATGTSTVVATAPAGAASANAAVAVGGYSTGAYGFTAVTLDKLPNSVDSVPDGTTYTRTLSAVMTGNVPDLSKGILGKTLVNIADGGGRYGVHAVDSNNLALIDFSQSGHVNKTLDNVNDGSVYLREPTASLSEVVPNGSFEASAALPPPGWTAMNANLAYTTGASGSGQALRFTTTVVNGGVYATKLYGCTPGDTFFLKAKVYGSPSGITNGFLAFYSDNGVTFYSNVVAFTAPASGGWGEYQGAAQVPASGAATFRLYFENAASGATVYLDDVSLVLVRAGPMLSPLMYSGARSVLSTSPITFSISGTTVSFTVGAFTVYAGGTTINYSAGSCSGTQSTGTTETWYVYANDPTGSGGSVTYQASTTPTNLANANGIVLVGTCTVTVASGGGGSGGSGSGGGGFCVADSMWIREGLKAGDAQIGDDFDCIDLPTDAGKHKRALRGLERASAECVRIITDNGCALVCSVDTPFDTPDSRTVDARHMLGEQVITDLGPSVVCSLALAGTRPVTRVHLGGVSFAAGANPHRRIYSHNSSIAKP